MPFQAGDYPDDLRHVLRDVLAQLVRHAKEAGWPDILWYFVDEPGADEGDTAAVLQWALLEFPLFRQTCPDEKTLCTCYTVEVFKLAGPFEVCVADLWRLNDGFISNLRESRSQAWGIRWLSQHNTYAFPRHFAGVGLDKRGLDGFTEWTYYGAPVYRPYAQLRDKEGVHYAYTDMQGRMLSTITWEAVQEGIDDARYVATLRRLISKAKKSDDPGWRTLGMESEGALNELMRKVPDCQTDATPLTQAELDNFRGAVAKLIVRFVRAGVYQAAKN